MLAQTSTSAASVSRIGRRHPATREVAVTPGRTFADLTLARSVAENASTRDLVKVHGSLFRAFLNAGASLKILLQGNVEHIESYLPNAWYSFDEFVQLLELTKRYTNSGTVLQQLGAEMMRAWYHQGPGRTLISSGVDFLTLQTSSAGFLSVIAGPPELVGSFILEQLDEEAGVARVRSTTICPREMERGVLMGGLGLIGDLLYYTVDNTRDADVFEISFVNRHNRHTLAWQPGVVLSETEWKFRHHVNMTQEKDQFWACINDTLNAAYSSLLELSTVDALTGVYNRRELLRLAEIELDKCKRNGTAMSVLYLDIDHFKRINDTYGHGIGDLALESFAKLCSQECRHYDLVGRLGGEEFCVVMPHVGMEAACALAERILEETRRLLVPLPDADLRFTVSIGVATYDGSGELDDLIGQADDELFRAKNAGRDRLSRPSPRPRLRVLDDTPAGEPAA